MSLCVPSPYCSFVLSYLLVDINPHFRPIALITHPRRTAQVRERRCEKEASIFFLVCVRALLSVTTALLVCGSRCGGSAAHHTHTTPSAGCLSIIFLLLVAKRPACLCAFAFRVLKTVIFLLSFLFSIIYYLITSQRVKY